MFVSFESFEHRKDPGESAQAIMGQLYAQYGELRDARILVLPPPPVRGLGSTAGFKMMVQDRADLGLDALAGTAFNMMADGSQTPGLAAVFTTFTTRVPQLSSMWIA
jgi:multidrug efflux pump subunit AcrB